MRARTTGAAVGVVGVALLLAAWSLVTTVQSSVKASIRDSATTRAQDVALLAHSGVLPALLPGRGEQFLVQVTDGDGNVLASTPSIEGQGPLVGLSLPPGDSRTLELASLGQGEDTAQESEGGADASAPFLVVARGVESTRGTLTVVVAASLSPVELASGALRWPLLVGAPILLLVVAITVWGLTGGALKPMEDIRAEAERISAADLDRRLPVPVSKDEVHRLAVTMNRLLDRIEASSTQQRRFVADASHELKSPVAAIRTMLEVAMRGAAPIDRGTLLDDLLAEDLRLDALVSDLLLLAHSDEGDLRLDLQEVDLEDLLLTEARMIGRRADLSIDVSGVEPVRVAADSARLGQVLRNLADNAARHARSRISFTLAIDAEAGQAVARVSDDGPGIPESDRERVFERFVRLDEARDRTGGGTGLGLAVSRTVSRAHRGDVRIVEPEIGGTTVEMRIPLG